MTTYVNMHGSDRLTVKQLEALGTVVDLGLADCDALLHDAENDNDNGIITLVEHAAAQAAYDKLARCLYRAKAKAEAKTEAPS